MLDAGYGSLGRAYEASGARLGMTPTRYRAGGAGEQLRCTAAPCRLGAVGIGVTARGLAAIELADTPEAALARVRERLPRAALEPADAALADTVAAVVAKIDAPGQAVELPLDIRGTAFQERVWRALQAIPAGTTRTYGEIARALGQPGAARAVGRAIAANRLAVAIPCHRAVPAGRRHRRLPLGQRAQARPARARGR
ncbi:MAG: methylated-DNA--[protein]-cysteine S-methyltransferase [Halofilum sp. (in: g-proteobacteria)]|nr:methylated-DNA--[protein]-cysteine S-methyltransferase [Halofilum sp. (in: g-proteobacteria)]